MESFTSHLVNVAADTKDGVGVGENGVRDGGNVSGKVSGSGSSNDICRATGEILVSERSYYPLQAATSNCHYTMKRESESQLPVFAVDTCNQLETFLHPTVTDRVLGQMELMEQDDNWLW